MSASEGFLSQGGTSVGYQSTIDLPSVFFCRDFPPGLCCEDCHTNNYVIAVYPWSCYSTGKDRMPDLTLGIRAEICCSRFHSIRSLPREWWLRKYAEKHSYSKEDQERLAQTTAQTFYRISGEISSKYQGVSPKIIVKGSPKIYKATPKPKGKGCPMCGNKWDGYVCENCGHVT